MKDGKGEGLLGDLSGVSPAGVDVVRVRLGLGDLGLESDRFRLLGCQVELVPDHRSLRCEHAEYLPFFLRWSI